MAPNIYYLGNRYQPYRNHTNKNKSYTCGAVFALQRPHVPVQVHVLVTVQTARTVQVNQLSNVSYAFRTGVPDSAPSPYAVEMEVMPFTGGEADGRQVIEVDRTHVRVGVGMVALG